MLRMSVTFGFVDSCDTQTSIVIYVENDFDKRLSDWVPCEAMEVEFGNLRAIFDWNVAKASLSITLIDGDQNALHISMRVGVLS